MRWTIISAQDARHHRRLFRKKDMARGVRRERKKRKNYQARPPHLSHEVRQRSIKDTTSIQKTISASNDHVVTIQTFIPGFVPLTECLAHPGSWIPTPTLFLRNRVGSRGVMSNVKEFGGVHDGGTKKRGKACESGWYPCDSRWKIATSGISGKSPFSRDFPEMPDVTIFRLLSHGYHPLSHAFPLIILPSSSSS